MTLVDDSSTCLSLTLWNDDLDRIVGDESTVVYLTRVRTKVYGGFINLVLTEASGIEFNLENQRTAELAAWWKTHKTDPRAKLSRMENTLNFKAMRTQLDPPKQTQDPAPSRF